MTIYNITAVALLTRAVVALRMQGPLLWPGIILHTALAGWWRKKGLRNLFA